jgi:molybdopterin/thiamine biosynthesis adenylyltransferase
MVRKAYTERMKLEFALTEKQHADVRDRLFGEKRLQPQDTEHGFLAAIFTATGSSRRTLLLGPIVDPNPGDVFWSPKTGLIMSHQYYSRALSVIQSMPGAGLINVHSHPRPRTGVSPPEPSPKDLATDSSELCFAARALPEGRPIAAGIVTYGGGISVREYTFRRPRSAAEAQSREFGPAGAKIVFAERIRIVGPGLCILPGDPSARASRQQHVDLNMNDSSILLWGERGQRILSGLSIGIAGLGGVGGILAEHLARLGVGTLLLVDYDRFEIANFNRSQGATRSDVESRLPKIDVYARIAKSAATAPNFRISAFRESVAEPAGLKPLLDCDIVVCAADDAFARQVVDHAAYSHLIPVIDGGTILVSNSLSMTLQAGKSQVVSAGPEHACLECQGVYTQEEATVVRESASWGKYVVTEADAEPSAKKELRAPSVICNNALVASLIGLRILAIALGMTPGTVRGTQRYYVEAGSLNWGAIKECKPGCPKSSWIGLGDGHFVPTGIDLRWKEVREKEAKENSIHRIH